MSAPQRAAVALHRVSTGDALVAALQERVLDGTLPGGTALREAELRDAFGVSRHTVRTALQTLAHRGLVRHEPNRSASVSRITPDDVRDLFRLRLVLELTAAAQVSGDRAALAPARHAVDTLERIAPDTPWGVVRDTDIAFHTGLIDALGSPRISRAFGALAAELRLCFVQLVPELVDHPAVAGQHREILTALESGETDTAVSLLQAHLDRSRDDIVAGYEERAVGDEA
jgi:DNA-binding GntR family transcriptional regulator